MSAESDARVLSNLRRWRESNTDRLRSVPNSYRVPIYLDEFDLLLRIADERDELARKLCEMPDEKPPVDHAAYVVTTCPACGHAPHGIGMICWQSATCGCRNGITA